jgi:hypothetical protein
MNTNNNPLRPDFDLADPTTLKLDLANPKPKDVLALVEAFETDIQTNPDLGPVPCVEGWNQITPAIAVNLLRRNHAGANRKIDPPTVFYYANQMERGQWMATGQPILINTNGWLLDSQHRLLAVMGSGVTIKSYVVTSVEPIPNIFAYIDNSRPRTAATALQTAGYNGVASAINKVITIGEQVRLGVFNPTGITKLPRLAPIDVLGLIPRYPNAQKAARSAASDWEPTVTYVGGRKDIIGYLGMAIIDLYNEDLADDFFAEIVDDTGRALDHPIAKLRQEIDKDNKADKPLKKHHMLAALIKTFNAWHKGESLGRRWMLAVNEDFPALDQPESEVEQAAAQPESEVEPAVV